MIGVAKIQGELFKKTKIRIPKFITLIVNGKSLRLMANLALESFQKMM